MLPGVGSYFVSKLSTPISFISMNQTELPFLESRHYYSGVKIRRSSAWKTLTKSRIFNFRIYWISSCWVVSVWMCMLAFYILLGCFKFERLECDWSILEAWCFSHTCAWQCDTWLKSYLLEIKPDILKWINVSSLPLRARQHASPMPVETLNCLSSERWIETFSLVAARLECCGMGFLNIFFSLKFFLFGTSEVELKTRSVFESGLTAPSLFGGRKTEPNAKLLLTRERQAHEILAWHAHRMILSRLGRWPVTCATGVFV